MKVEVSRGLRILSCEQQGLFFAEVRQNFFPKKTDLLKAIIAP
jgi:hypothetical protein